MLQFARLTPSAPIPEDTTIMKFRHLLKKHPLAAGVLAFTHASCRLITRRHVARTWALDGLTRAISAPVI